MNMTPSTNACVSCGSERHTFLFRHHYDWQVVRCDICTLTQVIPRPSRKEVAALYHNDFENFAPYFAQITVHRAYFHKKAQEILQLLGIKNGKKVTKKPRLLDVGCAVGVLLEEAKKLGMTAQGVDFSKGAVKYCVSHGLDVWEGSISSVAKKIKEKCDVITAFEVIEHEYDPRSMMQTIYTLLKPGGYTVVTTPNHASIWRKLMGKYWFGYTHREHLYFFDPQSITMLLRSVGFRTVTVKSEEARPFPLSFAFTRSADYFPWAAPLLRFLGILTKRITMPLPVNPWGDMIVIAQK